MILKRHISPFHENLNDRSSFAKKCLIVSQLSSSRFKRLKSIKGFLVSLIASKSFSFHALLVIASLRISGIR